MPTTFAALDQNLPRFTGQESLEVKVKLLQDYQYQLLEQLRYALNNLDLRNFNQKAVADWTQGITEPIYARLEDDEGNLNQLAITAQGLQAQISDAKGNITSLQATASSLQTQITNNVGDISSLKQTAASLQTQITNQSGDISSLQQTASSLQTQITNQSGDISGLQQTASGLQTLVSNQAGDISAMQQTVDEFSWSIADLEEGQAASLRLNARGLIYSDDEGVVSINGAQIEANTVIVDSLYGDDIYLLDSNDDAAAIFSITGASSYRGGALDILTGALRMTTYGGDIFLDAADGGWLQVSDLVTVGGDLIPGSSDKYTCGSYGFPWADVYSTDGTISSSDREKKFDIDYDMAWTDALVDGLKPCSFRRTVGSNYRRHTGLIAQDVAAVRDELEIPDSELAAYCEWTLEDGTTGCGLRYEEFIGILIYQVQQLKRRVAALEGDSV